MACWRTPSADLRANAMLDRQNQGPQCTACGSPMKLSAIEPSCMGSDPRSFTCLHGFNAPSAPATKIRLLTGMTTGA